MTLLWPRTLFARLMLIWIVGIAAVLAISFGLFLGERGRHDNDVLFEGVARETASAIDVLNQLGPAEREQWVEALGRRRLRISLDAPPEDMFPVAEQFGLIQALKRSLPDHEIALYVQRPLPERSSDLPHMRMLAVITLSDGSPVTIRLPVPPAPVMSPPTPLMRVLAALVALIAGITLLAWIAVRLATRPLSHLAEAAHALGEDPNRPALKVFGPTEVARAATAFNQMQQRLLEHVEERTRILAAISHDLQTPITRLMLRAELIEDEILQSRVQSDLVSMQALVKEGLAYARSLDASLPLQTIDVNGLIDALCEEAEEMGWPVDCSGHLGEPCLGQVIALRRALWNLIENGIKFGQRVSILLSSPGEQLHILIRDYGSGLPVEELEKVFEPFYRTEASRNRETGGTGLGLAISRNLLRAQGGDVVLKNAPDGGLAATVTLPKAKPATARAASSDETDPEESRRAIADGQ